MGQGLDEQRAWLAQCLRRVGVTEGDAREIARRCPYWLCKKAGHDLWSHYEHQQEALREAQQKAGMV